MEYYVNLIKASRTKLLVCIKSSLCLRSLENHLKCLWFLPKTKVVVHHQNEFKALGFLMTGEISTDRHKREFHESTRKWHFEKSGIVSVREIISLRIVLKMFCVSIQLTQFSWHIFHTTIICYQWQTIRTKCFENFFFCCFSLHDFMSSYREDEISGLFRWKFIKLPKEQWAHMKYFWTSDRIALSVPTFIAVALDVCIFEEVFQLPLPVEVLMTTLRRRCFMALHKISWAQVKRKLFACILWQH